MRLLALCALVVAAATVALAPSASASPYVRYGVQDDAWLQWGPGSLAERLDTLDAMGVDLARYTLDWSRIEPRKGTYDWTQADAILRGLHARGIAPVVTLWGTPRWANGGRSANWAPTSKWTFAGFARAAAKRYPFVEHWLIWNEPNKRMFLRPTSARVYVKTLLNPAYTAIHNASRGARVAGGVTAPQGGYKGLSPVAFIKGMRAAHAKLDAYAHNPYPRKPRTETPTSGACGHCETITMASLERLLFWVGHEWGGKRVWLTEYGYQTSPPDRYLGVSYAKQARFMGEAALRVYRAPRVDMLIHYIVRDDRSLAGWQSGLFRLGGSAKPAYRAAMLPLAQASRRGLRTVLWGQVRPRSGRQPYRLQQFRGGRWHWVGGTRRTSARGFFSTAVRAGHGSKLRIWSPRDARLQPDPEGGLAATRAGSRRWGRPAAAAAGPPARCTARRPCPGGSGGTSRRAGSGRPGPCRTRPRRRAPAAAPTPPARPRPSGSAPRSRGRARPRAAARPPRGSRRGGARRPRPSRRSRGRRRRGGGRAAASPASSDCCFQRTPTTTQSAVRRSFTLTTPSREPGRYGRPSRFATTPSSPAASSRSSHARPCASSRLAGEIRKPSSRSTRARRSSSGSSCTGSPAQSRQSKTTSSAGISPASLRIRLSAGWSRICIRSNSSLPSRAITISASSAECGGSSSPSGRSSGK